MEKKTLKLSEFYQLEAELNGVINQQTGEKLSQGLLSQKLPLNIKYWLNDMAKKVKEQKDECEVLKDEIIKKYGEEKDGIVQIKMTVKDDNDNDVINPAFVSFQNEFQKLLTEERELEYKQLKLSDIGNIETEDSYDLFFSLLNVEEM
jgi:hypothetical protein